MKENDLAERFSHDVDNLLEEKERDDTPPMSVEYRQNLDLARILVMADFSDESSERESLRRRLLQQIDTRETWSGQNERIIQTVLWKRHPAITLITVIMTLLLLVSLVWPDSMVAAAQGIANFVQSLQVGDFTSVYKVEPERAAAHTQREPPEIPQIVQSGDNWSVRTAIGNFGGNVAPGQDATVHRFDSIVEAKTATPFDLRLPTHLPDGYAFREAIVAPVGWVFLFYDGPDSAIILVEMLVHRLVEEQADGYTVTVDTEVVSAVTITDATIEEVELNGRPAAWIEGGGLMWEADGVSYTLGGVNLSLEETLHIAESLE
ncbi:MAG: DUF4367 domain-containing protein [Chloroflexota bacterium]|nr:DUF4367 domain-containing protein [Chloroflexota bacterium]